MSREARRTVYTVIQSLIGFLVALPLIIDATGISETAPGVGIALAVSGFVTRIMDIPQVHMLLSKIGLCDSPQCQTAEDQDSERSES